MSSAILHVLPLLNHAQSLIVQVNNLDRQTVLQTGGEFLHIHHKRAFPRNAGNCRPRVAHLHAHGRWQSKSHRAESAGVNPTPWFVKVIILGGEHLMLTHVRTHKSVSAGDFVQALNGQLRQNRFIRLGLQIVIQAVFRTPVFELLPPAFQTFFAILQSRLLLTLKRLR